jgi:hypothetical protein
MDHLNLPDKTTKKKMAEYELSLLASGGTPAPDAVAKPALGIPFMARWTLEKLKPEGNTPRQKFGACWWWPLMTTENPLMTSLIRSDDLWWPLW